MGTGRSPAGRRVWQGAGLPGGSDYESRKAEAWLEMHEKCDSWDDACPRAVWEAASLEAKGRKAEEASGIRRKRKAHQVAHNIKLDGIAHGVEVQ